MERTLDDGAAGVLVDPVVKEVPESEGGTISNAYVVGDDGFGGYYSGVRILTMKI